MRLDKYNDVGAPDNHLVLVVLDDFSKNEDHRCEPLPPSVWLSHSTLTDSS